MQFQTREILKSAIAKIEELKAVNNTLKQIQSPDGKLIYHCFSMVNLCILFQ